MAGMRSQSEGGFFSSIAHFSRTHLFRTPSIAKDIETEIETDVPGSDVGDQRLTTLIEGEIIPRLLLAHTYSKAAPTTPTWGSYTLGEGDVVQLAKLLLSGDHKATKEFVAGLRLQGVRVDYIFLELFAPAANLLGDYWRDDRCDFTEVALGLARLHQLVREMSRSFCDEQNCTSQNLRILLASAPGEEHVFGILMVEEFFRRAGWDVLSETGHSQDELLDTVRTEWFDMIGLSLGNESLIDELASLITAIRRESRNPGVFVMVGGAVFGERPELVRSVGADATAENGEYAVAKAEELVGFVARSFG